MSSLHRNGPARAARSGEASRSRALAHRHHWGTFLTRFQGATCASSWAKCGGRYPPARNQKPGKATPKRRQKAEGRMQNGGGKTTKARSERMQKEERRMQSGGAGLERLARS